MPPELIAIRGQGAPENPAPPKKTFIYWPVLLLLVAGSWWAIAHYAEALGISAKPAVAAGPVAVPAPAAPPPAVTDTDLNDLSMHLQRANDSFQSVQREIRQEDGRLDAVLPDIVRYRLWSDREHLLAGQESGTSAIRDLNAGLQEIQILEELVHEKTTREKP